MTSNQSPLPYFLWGDEFRRGVNSMYQTYP